MGKGVDFGNINAYSNPMSSRVIAVIFLLVVALLIQNTCPNGFAGKSSVASACSHCPQKQAFKGPAFSSITKASAHLPLFVLDIPNTQPSFRLAAIATPQPVIPNIYKNTAPDELLQPPRA